MPLPNFLVIGVPKAGSTSLYDYLRPHPEIFMTSRKATRFFCYNGQKNRSTYPVRTLEEYGPSDPFTSSWVSEPISRRR